MPTIQSRGAPISYTVGGKTYTGTYAVTGGRLRVKSALGKRDVPRIAAPAAQQAEMLLAEVVAKAALKGSLPEK